MCAPGLALPSSQQLPTATRNRLPRRENACRDARQRALRCRFPGASLASVANELAKRSAKRAICQARPAAPPSLAAAPAQSTASRPPKQQARYTAGPGQASSWAARAVVVGVGAEGWGQARRSKEAPVRAPAAGQAQRRDPAPLSAVRRYEPRGHRLLWRKPLVRQVGAPVCPARARGFVQRSRSTGCPALVHSAHRGLLRSVLRPLGSITRAGCRKWPPG